MRSGWPCWHRCTVGVPVGRGVTVGGHGFLAALPAGFDRVGYHGRGLDARAAHADQAFVDHGLLTGVRDGDGEGRFTGFGGGARPELHDAGFAGGEAVDRLGSVGELPRVGDRGGQVDLGRIRGALVGDGDLEDGFAQFSPPTMGREARSMPHREVFG